MAALRSFNRVVTARIGGLDQDYLARHRSLGASRLLWEIGACGADVRQLRARLGLDSGYVSRLLRQLESKGLVVLAPAADDRRVRVASLTAAGLEELRELDRLSDQLVSEMLGALDAKRCRQLVEAATTVERLITAGMVTVDVADPRGEAAQFCMESYFAELRERFEEGFDQALSTSTDYTEFAPPAGLLLIASVGGQPIGCGALKLHEEAPPDIKRMWIAPSARGLGVGRRLLSSLEHEAAARGHRRVRLETNRVLDEALALYRSAGYSEVEPFNDEYYAHHWFEKQLDSPGETP